MNDIATIFISAASLIITILVNYFASKLNREAQALELRKLVVDANDSLLSLEKVNDDASKKKLYVVIEKMLNAYEVICYIERRRIFRERFHVLFGYEMKQIITEQNLVGEYLNTHSGSYKYINRAIAIMKMKRKSIQLIHSYVMRPRSCID